MKYGDIFAGIAGFLIGGPIPVVVCSTLVLAVLFSRILAPSDLGSGLPEGEQNGSGWLRLAGRLFTVASVMILIEATVIYMIVIYASPLMPSGFLSRVGAGLLAMLAFPALYWDIVILRATRPGTL